MAAKARASRGLLETNAGRGILLLLAARWGAIFGFGACTAFEPFGLGIFFAAAGLETAAAFFLRVFLAATVLILVPFFLIPALATLVFLAAAFVLAPLIAFFGPFVAFFAFAALPACALAGFLAGFGFGLRALRAEVLDDAEARLPDLRVAFAPFDEVAALRAAALEAFRVWVAELARFGFATALFTVFVLRAISRLPGLP